MVKGQSSPSEEENVASLVDVTLSVDVCFKQLHRPQ